MNKVREALGEYASLVYFFVILVLIGFFVYFVFIRDNTKDTNSNIRKQNSNVLYAPGKSTQIQNSSADETAQNKTLARSWPKDFYIIAENLIPQNSPNAQKYYFGQKITLDQNNQIIENGGQTGRYVVGVDGLVSPYFYTFYKKVFPLNVDAYTKLPLGAKYQTMLWANAFCNDPNFDDQGKLKLALFADSPKGDVPIDNNCEPSYTMSKVDYVAQRSVAYADMDGNPITPKNIFIVMQPREIYGQNACNGKGGIFYADANEQYTLRPVNYSNICYVESVSKGALVPITKLGVQNIYGEQTENQTLYKMPASGFALHLSDSSVMYLIIDNTETGSLREISSRQNIYNYQYGVRGSY